ncbi:transcriptional regulator [Terrilactibacillus sp. BCM23-1]|uniref:Transcriptional regulator n=1 Tax=Terrilactibacillus tamarindi TaxID=2599694 RepID=A0A6N8CV41_9BACI|nr:transcriptional regulator SplA domain-containing protein [Terrilactibacillus tamarindi]MTT33297.1 transcriptional regulator [Terrilactibacillus tamarindi]
MDRKKFEVGDHVYVIYRNPHTANVANITQAEIVQHPENEDDIALFLHEDYHLIEDDDAIYSTFTEAETEYNRMFDYEQYD